MQNRLLIVGILAVISFYNVQCQEPITCTAGYYRPGETAKITCHYHADITTDRNSGAYIQRHKIDARDSSSGMEVTVCHFSGGSVSVCDPEAGYRFVSFSSRNLTIDVPHVSAEFQGRYTCGLVPPPGESPSRTVHPCLLVVEEVSQLEEKNNVQNGPGVHEGVHGHVQATLALLIIVIIAAVALIAYTVVAYNKTWFPFRKISEPKKKDAEKGEKLDFGDSTRPILQETTNPTFNANVSALPPPVQPEKEPFIKGGNDRASGPASEDEVTAKRGSVMEAKPETEDERQDRENRGGAERAEEEIRQAKRKLEGLKQQLNDVKGKEEKKNIEKDIKKNEEQLKKLKKTEGDRKTRLEKEEKERKKREEKERKDMKKAEKGKKK